MCMLQDFAIEHSDLNLNSFPESFENAGLLISDKVLLTIKTK